jgi:hypothetical protein
MMKNKYTYSDLAPRVTLDYYDGMVMATIDGYDIFEEYLEDHATKLEAAAKATEDCIAYAMKHGLITDRI